MSSKKLTSKELFVIEAVSMLLGGVFTVFSSLAGDLGLFINIEASMMILNYMWYMTGAYKWIGGQAKL